MTIDRLTQIAEEIKTTREKYATAHQALLGNPDYSQEFKAATAAKNRETMYQAIGRLGGEARTIRAAMTALRPPAGGADVLSEMQQQQAWQRLRVQLDAGRGLDELLAEARNTGDLTAVRALRAEAPSYFGAKLTASITGGDEGVIKKRIDAQLSELRLKTDIALGVVAKGEERHSARDRARLVAVWPVVEAHLDEDNAYPGMGRARAGFAETMSAAELAKVEAQFA